MYHQLTSQQRSLIDLSLAQQEIFALLQRKTPRKEIACIVECSQSSLCRELKRNSTAKGNYLWEKAHAKAMSRRIRTTSNKKLDSVLEWRIKQMSIRPKKADLILDFQVGISFYSCRVRVWRALSRPCRA